MFEAERMEVEWKTVEKFWKGAPTLGTDQSKSDVWMYWYHTSLLWEGDKEKLNVLNNLVPFLLKRRWVRTRWRLGGQRWDCCKLGVNCQLLPPTKDMVEREWVDFSSQLVGGNLLKWYSEHSKEMFTWWLREPGEDRYILLEGGRIKLCPLGFQWLFEWQGECSYFISPLFLAFQYKKQPKDKAPPGFCADEEWQNISPGIASLVIVFRLLGDLWLVASDWFSYTNFLCSFETLVFFHVVFPWD